MNSFISWVGGKKLLRKDIINRFPSAFDRYVEVFGGAAWVLFYKDKGKNEEIYNDINGELVNLFRCVKYHPESVENEFKLILNSREIFEIYSQNNTNGMTDIQRAVRYLYLIKASYASKTTSFGAKYRDITNLEYLHDVKERLSKVVIEHKSFDKLIKQYDKSGTLFYCDPPYHNTEKMYDTGDFVFDEVQHVKLRDMLGSIKGNFILSYNDDKYIRMLYKDFHIEEIKRSNNMALRTGNNKLFSELIIRNY